LWEFPGHSAFHERRWSLAYWNAKAAKVCRTQSWKKHRCRRENSENLQSLLQIQQSAYMCKKITPHGVGAKEIEEIEPHAQTGLRILPITTIHTRKPLIDEVLT
jgi:hypothetical protein